MLTEAINSTAFIKLSDNQIGLTSYALSALFYFLVAIALRLGWRNLSQNNSLWISCLITSLWSGSILAWSYYPEQSLIYIIQLLEFFKTCGWLALLASIIGYSRAKSENNRSFEKRQQERLMIAALVIAAMLFVVILTQPIIPQHSWLIAADQLIILLGFMILSILGVIFSEQIIRNTPTSERWNVKFFCLSIGVIFAYDFLMYSHGVLFNSIHPALWQARGFVYTLLIPLLLIGARRDSTRPLALSMSRRFVFRTGTLVAASIYLIGISLIGFYFKQVGGTWGELIQTLFLVFAVVALLLLLSSGGVRAKLNVWLSQNFFSYRYDYREEWISLNEILTDIDSGRHISTRALTAISNIVESVGGILWYTNEHGQFEIRAHQAVEDFTRLDHPLPKRLVEFWHSNESVINVDKFRRAPEKYPNLELPEYIIHDESLWLLVPLFLHDKVVGAIYLFKPRASFELNWENYDLLKISARQVCSYLAQDQATQALTRAKQFAAVNQATAFLIHDIKTMVSQLTLLVKNSNKHKNNPAFIDDMIKTIDHTANKMNHILVQLKESHQLNTSPSKDGKPTEIVHHASGEASTALTSGETHHSETVIKEPVANPSMQNSDPAATVTKVCDLIKLLNHLVQSHRNSSPKPELVFIQSTDNLEAGESLDAINVLGQYEHLYSAFNHLIQNAKEATAQDGSIRIEVAPPGSESITIKIVDNGIGMSPEFVRERLFLPFESTKGLTGMGIGAYQSREYIQIHGGELSVESQQNFGTTFTIKLKLEIPEEQK